MSRLTAVVLSRIQVALQSVAIAGMAMITALTVTDVVGRYFFNAPLPGATELTEFGIAIVVFSALPAVTWRQKHVRVDLLEKYFGAALRAYLRVLIHLLFTVSLTALGIRIVQMAARAARRDVVSEYLSIPLAWIQHYIAALCFITAAGTLLMTFTALLAAIRRR